MMSFNGEQESPAAVAVQIEAAATEANVQADSHLEQQHQPPAFFSNDEKVADYPGEAAGDQLTPSDEDAVARFVERCGLASADGAAEQLLLGLDPEARSAVLADFDPGGTKDGNVLGRLQGFAAAVEGRRKRMRGSSSGASYGRTLRPRRT